MSNWSLLAPVSVAGQRDFEARDKSARIGSQSNWSLCRDWSRARNAAKRGPFV